MFRGQSDSIDTGTSSEKLWSHTKNSLQERAIKRPAGLLKKFSPCPLLGGLQTGTSLVYDKLCLDLPEVRSMKHGAFLRFFWAHDFIMIEHFFWVEEGKKALRFRDFIHVSSFWNFWHRWLGDGIMQPSRSLVIAALGPVIHVTQKLCFCASLSLYVFWVPRHWLMQTSWKQSWLL